MSKLVVVLETEQEVLNLIKRMGGEARPVDVYKSLGIFRNRSYFRLITMEMMAKGLIKYNREKNVFVLGERKQRKRD